MRENLAQEKVWPHQLVDTLANRILGSSNSISNDFSNSVVVLPSLAVASVVSRRLMTLASSGLILPEFTTFDSWSRKVSQPFETETKRYYELLIYQELEKYQWLDRGNNWNLAVDMTQLIGELDLYQSDLILDSENLDSQFNQAYQTCSHKLVSFESKLLFDIWHAMTGVKGGRASEQVAYRFRLACLARTEGRRLYVVKYPDFSPAEQFFIESYASRNPVLVLDANISCSIESVKANFCRAAFQSGDFNSETSGVLKEHPKIDPWKPAVKYYSAVSLEQEVRAIQLKIQQWLNADLTKIAIVPFDRKVARRLRALLQQSKILVQDEFGWKMSTTAVAAILSEWLDLIACDLEIRQLISFLNRPGIARMPGATQLRLNLEKSFKKDKRWDVDFELESQTNQGATKAREILLLIQGAKHQLEYPKFRTHRDWTVAVLLSLESVGVQSVLERDAAGEQLLDLLRSISVELNSLGRVVDFKDWFEWLKAQLEVNTFRDSEIESSICFTTLKAARMRSFDGIIFAGADDVNFPLSEVQNTHFTDGVRAQLGLRTTDHFMHIEKVGLIESLLGNQNILVTWQKQKNNEHNLLSPWFENFRIQHAIHWGGDLMDEELELSVRLFEQQQRLLQNKHERLDRPAIGMTASELPERISVSGYQSLLDCPYQFFIRHVLRSREPDALDIDPKKREMGNVLHEVLEKFHKKYPTCSEVGLDILHKLMMKIARETFASTVGSKGVVHGWSNRFRGLFSKYLEWQIEWEQSGWTIAETETTYEKSFSTRAGISRVFYGRVDRVDERDARRMVVDYKSQSPNVLKKLLSLAREHIQLISYISIQSESHRGAMYLSLDKKSVSEVGLDVGDIDYFVSEHMNRLANLFSDVEEGVALPANGDSNACKYCDVRSACQKGVSWRPQ